MIAGLWGVDSIAELCRQEGISQGLYYSWSKEFLEAGKKRLTGGKFPAVAEHTLSFARAKEELIAEWENQYRPLNHGPPSMFRYRSDY